MIVGVPAAVDLITRVVQGSQAGIYGLLFEVLHGHVETFGERRPVLHRLVFDVGIEIGDGWVADSIFYVATVFAIASAATEEFQSPISLVTHLLHDSGNVAVVKIKSFIR